jgi:hypothetical protein
MQYSDDFITNSFFKIKNNYIYGYTELNKIFSKENINEIVTNFVEKNTILKCYYIYKNEKFFMKQVDNLNINEHYKIIYTNFKNKNKFLHEIINLKIKTEINWFLYVLIDKENNKTIFYFKIDHSYCDGYGLINFFNYNISDVKKFKRIPNNYFSLIYNYLIGTIILFISLLKFIYNFYNFYKKEKKEEKEEIKTDFIFINRLNLNQIKIFALKHDISINDFLFSLMIKTDYIYTEQKRNLKIIIPINTNNTKNTNNILPLFVEENNDDENSILIKKINRKFNNYKYSLFIPILSYLINKYSNNIPIDIDIFNNLINYTDYKFTNIICPPLYLNNMEKFIKVNYLTNVQGNEKTFNIISYENKITMIITFKKGSINKKKFKNDLYKAYNSLITT